MQSSVRAVAASTLSLGLCLAVAGVAAAQERGSFGERPRFVAAVAGRPAPVEVEIRSVPALHQRISLTIEDASLKDALGTVERTAGVEFVYSPSVVNSSRRVTIRAENMTVAAVLTDLLVDAKVDVLLSGGRYLTLIPRASSPSAPTAGTITGIVTAAETQEPVASAQVAVEGTGLGTLTDNEGEFNIADVPVGRHVVTVQSIGYRTVTREVDVADGAIVTVDFALEVLPTALNELVVTGSIVETRRREMPVSVAVVDAADIEIKQLERVDQLFMGTIPGAIAWDLGHNDYVSQISIRGRTSLGGDYIKTYIDGVEVAEPNFLNFIDPKSIERIEVIRGPQASTLYGSDALGGVLQIFTKKGSRTDVDRPRLGIDVSTKFIETDYGAEDPPVIDEQKYGLELSGGSDSYSYNVGATHIRQGEYVPNWWERRTGGFGSVQATQGRFNASASMRYVNRSYGFGQLPRLLAEYPSIFGNDVVGDRFEQQHTLGLNLGFVPIESWRHSLVVGVDRHNTGYRRPPSLNSPADTFATMADFNHSRVSLRYNTAIEYQPTDDLSSSIIAGFDYWKYDYKEYYSDRIPLTVDELPSGTVSPTASRLSWRGWSNKGYFAQAKLGYRDRLFLTAGARAEYNGNFGEDVGLVWSPQLGAAYIQQLGSSELKLRGAWGRAIRPPDPNHRLGQVTTATAELLANPEIGPEEQTGWEGGIDVFLRGGVTLGATYYDQKVRDLIQVVMIDPSPSYQLSQYQNVGRIRNNGWEFEGSLNLAGVRLHGTYSITKSRIETLSPTYAGDLQVGDDNLAVPANVLGASLEYDFLGGSASLELSRKGTWIEHDYLAYYADAYGLSGKPYRGSLRAYWMDYDPMMLLHFRMHQNLTDRLGIKIAIENLTNNQDGEPYNLNGGIGRTILVGLRLTY